MNLIVIVISLVTFKVRLSASAVRADVMYLSVCLSVCLSIAVGHVV